jgi:hypothetical protein
LSLSQMTFDHVIPKKWPDGRRRGKTVWDNIVCSCQICNNKKGSRTPEEAGMQLVRRPVAPLLPQSPESELMMRLKHLRHIPHDSWKSYIYWNVELQD